MFNEILEILKYIYLFLSGASLLLIIAMLILNKLDTGEWFNFRDDEDE